MNPSGNQIETLLHLIQIPLIEVGVFKCKNILERIIFFDDYSKPMKSPVTKENEKYYLKDISLDIEYFGRSYKKAKFKNILMVKMLFSSR